MKILTTSLRSAQVLSWVFVSLLVPTTLLPAQVVITNIPGLGGSAQEARGLNRNGMVAGFARTFGDTNQHAFIFSGGETHDLGGNFSQIGRASCREKAE